MKNAEVKITLGGKQRKLIFDLNAQVEFEGITGYNTLQEDFMSKLNARDVRAFMWACTRTNHPDLTIEEVGSWIHPGNMEQVFTALKQAWEAAYPEPDPKEKKSPQSSKKK